jgi:His-Xaa-Ser system protein HxsD
MKYEISKTIFNKETLLKVVYLWQEDFIINIVEDEYNWIISVESKHADKEFHFDNFNKKLQEQQLRETLNNQFGNLRDNIYNRAFQHFQG